MVKDRVSSISYSSKERQQKDVFSHRVSFIIDRIFVSGTDREGRDDFLLYHIGG